MDRRAAGPADTAPAARAPAVTVAVVPVVRAARVPAAGWRVVDLEADDAPLDLAGVAWVVSCVGLIKPHIREEEPATVGRAVRLLDEERARAVVVLRKERLDAVAVVRLA